MRNLSISTLVFCAVLACALAAAQDAVPAKPTEAIPNCATCHVTGTPTPGDAALRACPRPRDAAKADPNAEPDVVIMDKLSEIYVPVVFPHKLHASMTDMGVGCATCHHSNPPGRILKCSECHDGPSKPSNLEQPSLKGAYHRQCLNCHREWDHKTDCTICHAKRVAGVTPDLSPDPTDIMGKLHPNITPPVDKLYTPKDESALPVTFRHQEHTQVFGVKCVECHRQQNCNDCHDAANHKQHVRQDPHEDCIRCHEKETNDNCTYCHAEEKVTGFDHQRVTGHALAAYHSAVTCRQCHPGRGRMIAPKAECAACHAEDWVPKSFDHSVTGVVLDDDHKDLDCVACHPKGMGRPRDCSACHDDGRTTFAEKRGDGDKKGELGRGRERRRRDKN